MSKSITNSSTCNPTLDTCLALAEMTYGFNDVTFDSSTNECIYNIDCDNAILDIDGSNVEWSSLSEYIKDKQGGVSFFEQDKPSGSNRILQNCSDNTANCMIENLPCKGLLNGYPSSYTISAGVENSQGSKCNIQHLPSTLKINLDGSYCYNGYNFTTKSCKNK